MSCSIDTETAASDADRSFYNNFHLPDWALPPSMNHTLVQSAKILKLKVKKDVIVDLIVQFIIE